LTGQFPKEKIMGKPDKKLSIAIGILLFVMLTACSIQQETNVIVIRNGLLFKATGDPPIPNGAVVIKNGLISAVGPESELQIPEGATIVDAEGGTIMPGLIEGRASTLINEIDISEGQISETDLNLFLVRPLQAGITTIRAIGWDYATHSDLSEMREALETYGNTIPTLVFAGVITHAEGNVFAIYSDDSIGVLDREEAQKATEDLIQSGVDQVGYLQPIPPDYRAINAELIGLSIELQSAMVELAHQKGLRVLAQTSFPEDTAVAIAAGVDEIIGWPHGSEEPLSNELIQALVDNSVKVMTGFSVDVIRPYEDDVRRFIDAGGIVVFGTFAPNSTALDRPAYEMSLMATYGKMTPEEILMAATVNAADAVGLGDVVGTLEVNKQADIIIVQGDPLNDIYLMRNIHTVIKAGEIVFQADSED
jgi:imidazolonepropionase-like amidohydrolase